MAAVVRIVDEFVGQGRTKAFELRLASERITGRELVRRRVQVEVALANAKSSKAHAAHERTRSFLISFDANAVEAVLNPPRKPRKSAKSIRFDETEECDRALKALTSNRVIMLIDDRQIEDLDKEITVTPDSEVVFLRLTPLIGG